MGDCQGDIWYELCLNGTDVKRKVSNGNAPQNFGDNRLKRGFECVAPELHEEGLRKRRRPMNFQCASSDPRVDEDSFLLPEDHPERPSEIRRRVCPPDPCTMEANAAPFASQEKRDQGQEKGASGDNSMGGLTSTTVGNRNVSQEYQHQQVVSDENANEQRGSPDEIFRMTQSRNVDPQNYTQQDVAMVVETRDVIDKQGSGDPGAEGMVERGQTGNLASGKSTVEARRVSSHGQGGQNDKVTFRYTYERAVGNDEAAQNNQDQEPKEVLHHSEIQSKQLGEEEPKAEPAKAPPELAEEEDKKNESEDVHYIPSEPEEHAPATPEHETKEGEKMVDHSYRSRDMQQEQGVKDPKERLRIIVDMGRGGKSYMATWQKAHSVKLPPGAREEKLDRMYPKVRSHISSYDSGVKSGALSKFETASAAKAIGVELDGKQVPSQQKQNGRATSPQYKGSKLASARMTASQVAETLRGFAFFSTISAVLFGLVVLLVFVFSAWILIPLIAVPLMGVCCFAVVKKMYRLKWCTVAQTRKPSVPVSVTKQNSQIPIHVQEPEPSPMPASGNKQALSQGIEPKPSSEEARNQLQEPISSEQAASAQVKDSSQVKEPSLRKSGITSEKVKMSFEKEWVSNSNERQASIPL